MTESRNGKRSKVLEASVEQLHLENGEIKEESEGLWTEKVKEETPSNPGQSPVDVPMHSTSQSPAKRELVSQSPSNGSEKQEEVIGGEVTVKLEPGQPPKLARSTSQKVLSRPALLFLDCPSKTQESKATFDVIQTCSYSSKYIGSTEHDSMECDCTEEWDGIAKVNMACGPESDCINRATKMECAGDCGCGSDCQNQRFQRHQYGDVTVIKTEKKGYGLRADTDLSPDEFIYEYIGEVIDEARFRRRMVQYDEEGIKHFYFMSLTKGEFVDATKRGNLGRFCNHSCNPNCYVDKWVVGDKLRMGIFAERKIKAGEELVFNYNVDRYGANPQPCYCGEPNCTGFIGGKTQTERATKLSNTTIEALGINDGDGWDTAVAKKPRKKKAGEEDEEYVNNVQPKSLDENGVTKVMATLMQCKEKWIAVKLLSRIQRCDDERVRNRVVKMHGYQILNSSLALWKDDPNVVLQIFDILNKFPRLTRNKISDSKIETTVEVLRACGDERVEMQAEQLLNEWSTLEIGYRIPRKKREVAETATTTTPEKSSHYGRRESSRELRKRSRSRSKTPPRSRSRSIDAPRGPAAPSGPRSNFPQRVPGFYGGPRPPFRARPFSALPPGWFPATDDSGRTYYYDSSGKTTWERPTMPAAAPPPPPPKVNATNQKLEEIINSITNAKATTPQDITTSSSTPKKTNGDNKKEDKVGQEKWRGYSEEKQKKLYENTLYPHIKHVMEKFKGKLSKDDLKRFAKEISKKLVNSDFKNKRVQDPTKISSRQEKQVKQFVQAYFEKAVAKKRDHDKKKSERKIVDDAADKPVASTLSPDSKKEDSIGDEDMAMSDNEEERVVKEDATPITPLDQLLIAEGLKRKRNEGDDLDPAEAEDDLTTPSKRLKSETPPPPPPPPPPPTGEMPEDTTFFDGALEDEPNPDAPKRSHQMRIQSTEMEVDVSSHAHDPETPMLASPDQEDESTSQLKSHFEGRVHEQLPRLSVNGGA